MIITIRTENPEAEIGLFIDGVQLRYVTWQAHRALAETFHTKINDLLVLQGVTLQDVKGIVCYKGPGSFTGLRIGLSIANALAYSLHIPIVGSTGDDWIMSGIERLHQAENDETVLPEYGAPVHITQPKK
jgi:tRNA threonylcarbamoyladenosine biosynthesis protein TsaB